MLLAGDAVICQHDGGERYAPSPATLLIALAAGSVLALVGVTNAGAGGTDRVTIVASRAISNDAVA